MFPLPTRAISRPAELSSPSSSIAISVGSPVLPFTKKHLLVRFRGSSSNAGLTTGLNLRLNSDSGANYNSQYFTGSGSSETAQLTSAQNEFIGATSIGASATGMASTEWLILDAFSTTKFKSIILLGGAGEQSVQMAGGHWADLSAVTAASVHLGSGNFVTGSALELEVLDEMFAVPGAAETLAADGTFTKLGFSKLAGDLIFLGDFRSNVSADEDTIECDLNDDATDGDYDRRYLRGALAVESTDNTADREVGVVVGDTAAANAFSGFVQLITNYNGGDNDPHTLALSGEHADSGAGMVELVSSRRNNVEAVTKVLLAPGTGTGFKTLSSISVYLAPKTQVHKQELTADAASVTLPIPTGFETIRISGSARGSDAAALASILVENNSDSTGANYDRQRLRGDGSSPVATSSVSFEIAEMPAASATANIFGAFSITYGKNSKDDAHTQMTSIYGAAGDVVGLISSRWMSNDAVTQVVLSGNFAAGSIFTVEGIGKTKVGWEDDFGLFESIVEVDIDGDETFDNAADDLTATAQVQGFDTMNGRTFDVNNGSPVVGTLGVSLLNESKDFSYFESTSDYYDALKKGTLVRVRCDIPASRTIWFGAIDEVIADIDDTQFKSAQLSALGIISSFNDDAVKVEPQASIRYDLAIAEILDEAGFSSTRRDLDEAVGTAPYWFVQPKKPLTALTELEASEGMGIFRESEDGKAVFENDTHRLSIRGQTPQAVFSSNPGAGELLLRKVTILRNPDQMVRNDIRRTFKEYTPGSLATLWVAPVDQTIPAGETRTFTASIPNQTTQAIGLENVAIDPASDWTTPVVGTDITGHSAAGGGTDMNGDLSVGTPGKFSNAMTIPITNSGAVTVYLSKLEARGVPLAVSDPIEIADEDAASIAIHDRRTLEHPKASWIANAEEAHEANLIDLARFNQPTPLIQMIVDADSDHYRMAATLRLRVSDRITVTESSYQGIDEDFYIEAVRRRFEPRTKRDGTRVDRMVVTYDLSPAAGLSGFFIWGFSTWGVSTRASRA